MDLSCRYFVPSPNSPWDPLTMTGHSFGCQNCVEGIAPGILVEAKDAPKYPTMDRTTPTAKNYLVQNVGTVDVEKLCNL